MPSHRRRSQSEIATRSVLLFAAVAVLAGTGAAVLHTPSRSVQQHPVLEEVRWVERAAPATNATPVLTPIPTVAGEGQGWNEKVDSLSVLWFLIYYSAALGFPMVVFFAVLWHVRPESLSFRTEPTRKGLIDILVRDLDEGVWGWIKRGMCPQIDKDVLGYAGVDATLVVMFTEVMRFCFVSAGIVLLLVAFLDASPQVIVAANKTLHGFNATREGAELTGLSVWTIANVPPGSKVLWAHTLAAIAFVVFVCVQMRHAWNAASVARRRWIRGYRREKSQKKRTLLGGASTRHTHINWVRARSSMDYDPGCSVLLTGIRHDIAEHLSQDSRPVSRQASAVPQSAESEPLLPPAEPADGKQVVEELLGRWYSPGFVVHKWHSPPSVVTRTVEFAAVAGVIAVPLWMVIALVCGVSTETASMAGAGFIFVVGVGAIVWVHDEGREHDASDGTSPVAALVEFSTAVTAIRAAQILPGEGFKKAAPVPWVARPAPSPGQILWEGARLTWWERIPRGLLANSLAFVIAVCFAPLAQIFVNLLANLSHMARTLDEIVAAGQNGWVDWLRHLGVEASSQRHDPFTHLVNEHPHLANMIQGQLASLLLGTFLMYLPELLQVCARLGGAASKDEAAQFAVTWFGRVLVFSTALSGAVSSAVFRWFRGFVSAVAGEAKDMSVGDILGLLGQGVAEQSLTLVGLVLVRALWILPWELVPAKAYLTVFLGPLVKLLSCGETDADGRPSVSFGRALAFGGSAGVGFGLFVRFWLGNWAALVCAAMAAFVATGLVYFVATAPRQQDAFTHYMLAQDLLVAFAGISYGPICPLLVWSAALYFIIACPVRRFLLMYMYDPADSGGALWPCIFGRVMVAVAIMCVLLVSILLLNAPTSSEEGVRTGPMVVVIAVALLVAMEFDRHWQQQAERFFQLPIGMAQWLDKEFPKRESVTGMGLSFSKDSEP
eukprot:TRINITY_DN26109_c0_g1_i1.p1 TRINITY_DN26109_c0_g1~~TRINITY_DN26109_c0_g1_i1.p1  ORF type:complete len:949 (+),score=267.51 TRINITY_DN26109_c0_g1_i1:114-2960(+)